MLNAVYAREQSDFRLNSHAIRRKSDMGQSRRFERVPATSACPLTPDVSPRRSEPTLRARGGLWCVGDARRDAGRARAGVLLLTWPIPTGRTPNPTLSPKPGGR